MRKEVGNSAGFLALLALLFHTQFGGESAKPGSSSLTSEIPAAKADYKELSGNNNKAEPEGPWLQTRSFFHASLPSELAACGVEPSVIPPRAGDLFSSPIDDCQLREYFGIPEAYPGKRHVIIATVADPAHTRLALYTDRQIEAIENGLRASGWEFSRQWLPWVDSLSAPADKIDERRQSRVLVREQESIPGILIFRKQAKCSDSTDPYLQYSFANEVLFVLVVPETPTAGIQSQAFRSALWLAPALSSAGEKFGLLAPTFSGSLSSLAVLLCGWQCQTPTAQLNANIYSGTVSAFSEARAFENSCPGLHFYSSTATSLNFKEAFNRVLEDYSIPPSRAAYVVEGETGFGQDFTNPNGLGKEFTNIAGDIETFEFPRDISHLRNAYLEETGSTRSGPRELTPSINFSLKDPTIGEDSIPNYDGLHTPVSESAMVESIIHQLRRSHKRIVYVAATNPLDLLFLTRAIRQEVPDIRVVVGSPDILFIPETTKDSLTGTLFVSTYPMFFDGDEWLNPTTSGMNSRFLFPSPDLQGVYNAVQFLLTDINPQDRSQGDKLRSYRPPTKAHTSDYSDYPNLWLLSLTRYGFVPLNSVGITRSHSNFKQASKAEIPNVRFPLPSLGWFVTVIVVISVATVLYVVIICNNPKGCEPRFLS